jgi:hypothetical protein
MKLRGVPKRNSIAYGIEMISQASEVLTSKVAKVLNLSNKSLSQVLSKRQSYPLQQAMKAHRAVRCRDSHIF